MRHPVCIPIEFEFSILCDIHVIWTRDGNRHVFIRFYKEAKYKYAYHFNITIDRYFTFKLMAYVMETRISVTRRIAVKLQVHEEVKQVPLSVSENDHRHVANCHPPSTCQVTKLDGINFDVSEHF